LLLGTILLVVWIFTPLGILFIVGSLILFFSSSKAAKIFGWVMNVISFVITLLIGTILFIVSTLSGTLSNYIVVSMLITCILILAIMIIFITLIKKYGKK
jgi:hypothetical protein